MSVLKGKPHIWSEQAMLILCVFLLHLPFCCNSELLFSLTVFVSNSSTTYTQLSLQSCAVLSLFHGGVFESMTYLFLTYLKKIEN